MGNVLIELEDICSEQFPSSDSLCVMNEISYTNWIQSNDTYIDITTSTFSHLDCYDKDFLRTVLPVGSIRFVEKVLNYAYGIETLIPERIPENVLKKYKYWDRKIFFDVSEDKLEDFWNNMNHKKGLFVKSYSKVKCSYADVYEDLDSIPYDSSYVLSEVISLKSEYRVFVFNKMIMDVRYYCGDKFCIPDKSVIRDIVDKIGNDIPSYTLDVAITLDGKTVIMEIHNFISCGLYGAEIPIYMYFAAYRHELYKNNISDFNF